MNERLSIFSVAARGTARGAACAGLALLAACGEAPVEGGTVVIGFEGGALDGSEDAVLEAEAEADAGPNAESGTDPALEALAASYLTLPIDELLASMGLARDEATQMMDLPDETIRQLAIARLRRDALDPDEGGAPERLDDGRLSVRFRHLSLDALDDFEFEEVMDSLMEGEVRFPQEVAAFDEKPVEITGYMIPVEWQRREVTEFMLVRDLLACCFGGAPQPDEWIHVSMEEGKGSPYFPFVPVSVEGTLHIEGIDDGSGYAAGCFHLNGTAAREVR
ncbi:hypothetical protein Poly30_27400 [Planctomycetes bacterium Poly30]|uniref:DUF3299 domain-containing protein n=1 Tax=Saltatorellus ferox TaxID=2528018 RepID=A0A518ESZ7_9BACT|nr:hypothetical protein Poly30_27400 [Planctomycetes bacterium Poly30]